MIEKIIRHELHSGTDPSVYAQQRVSDNLVRFEFVPRMAQAFPMHGTSFSHAWEKPMVAEHILT